jgi:hypothetical protein
MVDPARIVQALTQAGVDYLVIGGMAATLHGCPEQTYDLDILYASTDENRRKLLAALEAIEAEWEQPLNDTLLKRQPVFALNTKFGDLDIFTTIPGLDDYATGLASSVQMELGGSPVRVLNLASLIATKEAAADPNPRKQSTLAYLKAVHEKRTE